MIKSLLSILIVLSFISCATPKNEVAVKPFYGKEIQENKAVKLDKVLTKYDQYAGKDIVMEAGVAKVCAKKGCWMTLQGSDKTFRVKFEDYSFFVPMTLIGKKVWVKGKVSRNEISIKDTKHYMKDAGASDEEIAKVTSPSFEYRIMATGVKPL